MNYLLEVATALKLSKTTICKAINRSKDISYETQQRVLDYIAEHFPDKLISRTMVERESKRAKIILVLMPYKPHFFWDKAIEGIEEAIRGFNKDEIAIKYAFYAGSLNEKEVLSVLNDIELSLVDAVAMVPMNSAAIAERINEINTIVPVATFCEQCEKCLPFISVASDCYYEGRCIAEMISESIEQRSKILVVRADFSNSLNIKHRIQGFLDRMAELYDQTYVSLDFCQVESPDEIIETKGVRYFYNSILPSLMARTMSPKLEDERDVAAIYVPDGSVHLMMGAMKKLGRSDIPIYGHEFYETSHDLLLNGCKGGYVYQNIKKQAYCLVDALASKLLKNEKKYPNKLIINFETCSHR